MMSVLSRLKHMVHDKIQSRDTGPKTPLERQPAKVKLEEVDSELVKWNETHLFHTVCLNLFKNHILSDPTHINVLYVKCVEESPSLIQKKLFIIASHVIINITLMKSEFHTALNYLYKNLKHNQFL